MDYCWIPTYAFTLLNKNLLKQKPTQVIRKFETLAIGSVALSSITLAELNYGVTKSTNPVKNQEALDMFLTPLEILAFDFPATLEYGKIRAALEQKGTPIGALDTFIAAHARSLNLTLVSNNEKEFQRVPDLAIENWVR
jgi:tRNA(fMet)-specific endonuclease VapC